ncbi:MAG: hypothetical protein ABSB52_09145 [Acidimicrobiales bacterium]
MAPFPRPNDPLPPDFKAMPPGVEAIVRARLANLPLDAVKTTVDRLAVASNESRFVRRLSGRVGLKPELVSALGAWYVTEVHTALATAVPPGEARTVPWALHHRAARSPLVRPLDLLWRNPLVIGFPSWVNNRKVELRALRLRILARQ